MSATGWAQLDEVTLAKRQKTDGNIWSKFKGSYTSLAFNLGTGSFITNKSDNPLFNAELTLYPRFSLGDYQSVRAYWVLECEFTEPEGREGRKCDPSDIRLSYHHTNIWQDPWLKGRVMGYAGIWLPTSYASININKVILNPRASIGYLVRFFNNKFELAYNFTVQKYFQQSKSRQCPFETDANGVARDGAGNILCAAGGYDAPGQDSGSGSSRGISDGHAGSGGTLNDNWLLINNLHVGYYLSKKWSFSADILIYNYFRYSVGSAFNDPNLPDTGRADYTWGIIEAAYQATGNLSLAMGISSLQSALTADNKSVRFPFYDFISPANNLTKWYLSATYIY